MEIPPIHYDGAIRGMDLSSLSMGAETNIHHIAAPLTSTLFCDKQFGVGINNGNKIFICVLTHICAVV